MDKQRFDGLDGLRGLAALMVAGFHIAQVYSPALKPEHAYLAVDFFFCLSGFVIAHAYDGAGNGLDFGRFMIRRLTRLYPMLFLSVLLGAAVLGIGWMVAGEGDLLTWLIFTVSSLILFPVGFFYKSVAYPIFNAIWSLAFELVANVLYGLKVGAKASRTVATAGFVALAIVLTMIVIHSHSIQAVGYYDPRLFAQGLVRVMFPFFAGVAIYRLGLWQRVTEVPMTILAVALMAMLAMPLFILSRTYDCLSLIVFTPLLVLFGAAATTKRLTGVCQGLGQMSYPLYLLHMPVLMACELAERLFGWKFAGLEAVAAILAISCVVSWLALKAYDEPVRRWLSRRRAPLIRPTSVTDPSRAAVR